MPTASKTASFCYGLVYSLCLLLTIGHTLLAHAPQAHAADYQRCLQNSSCVIGEFLFDDNYVPIATASCSLNSRDPAGNLFANPTLTPTADGWYAHTLNLTTETTGLYRSQICCSHETEYMCIDKSFTVETPPSSLTTGDVESAVWNADTSSFNTSGSFGEHVQGLQNTDPSTVADAVWNATPSAYTTPGTFGASYSYLSTIDAGDVWNYSNRELTDFGTLTTDIWNSPTRNLTSFGTLITDIWNNPTRSLSTFGTLITDIWNNPTRSLTSFGTLIVDIWDYSTRSLTSFGTLITDLWESDNRTLTQDVETDTSNLATTGDVAAIKTKIDSLIGQGLNYTDRELISSIATQVIENRDILDALINAPIVTTTIEDGEMPDLQSKIERFKGVTASLFAGVQQAQSRLGVVQTKWATLTPSARRSEITSIKELVQSDLNDTTITENAAWINDAWGGVLGEGLLAASTSLNRELTSGGSKVDVDPSRALAHLNTALNSLGELDVLTGSIADTVTDPTVYGKLYQVQAVAAKLDQNDQLAAGIIDHWDNTNPFKRSQSIATLNTQVLSVNTLENATSLLGQFGQPQVKDQNQVFGLKAINTINRSLLASFKSAPVRTLWLEEASVVFRSVIVNPSTRMSQKVPLEYFLPKELTQDDVVKASPELNIEYDPTAEALKVSGLFDLKPEGQKVFYVEVNDRWVISKDEVLSRKTQASELLTPLQKTPFFGQGATLKSDIDVTTDTILGSLDFTRAPEARIRFFRESTLKLAGVDSKLEALKTLVAQAGDSKNMFNVTTGTTAIAAWGIIIVLLGGFSFIALYLKTLRPYLAGAVQQAATSSQMPEVNFSLPIGKMSPQARAQAKTKKRKSPKEIRATRFFSLLVAILSTTILSLTALNLRAIRTKSTPPTGPTPSNTLVETRDRASQYQPGQVAGTRQTAPNSLPLPQDQTLALPQSSPLPTQAPPGFIINIPEGESVVLRDGPSNTSTPLLTLTQSLPARILKREHTWAYIQFTLQNTLVTGWLDQTYLNPQ